MDELWAQLHIAPTDDRRAVKRAYAARLKTTDAEKDPESFQQLREAYETILELIEEEQWDFDASERPVHHEDVADIFEEIQAEPQISQPDALSSAETVCHFCEQGNEHGSIEQLAKVRESDSYHDHQSFREAFELYVMVGLLETHWPSFPFEFAEKVQQPWCQEQLNPDQPFFQEKWELTQKIKAEILRKNINQALHKDSNQPLSPFDKAARILFTEPARLATYPIGKTGRHFRKIMIQVSQDFTGSFEDWIHANPHWKAWVRFETFITKQVRKRMLSWFLSSVIIYWFSQMVLKIDYFSSLIMLAVLLGLVEANSWHGRWRERRFRPRVISGDKVQSSYGVRFEP